YRLYEDDDVLRLQQVLVYRELGLPLEEIAVVINEPGFGRAEALRRHRAALIAKRGRLDAMVAALDAALRLEEGRTQMQPDDVKTLFEGFEPQEYAEEAEQRWGD